MRRLDSGQSVAEVARALELNPSELHRWRRELDERGERAFSGVGRKRAEESRVAESERKAGRQAAAPIAATGRLKDSLRTSEPSP